MQKQHMTRRTQCSVSMLTEGIGRPKNTKNTMGLTGSTSPVVMRMGALQLLLAVLYLFVLTTTINDCARKEDNKTASQLPVSFG